MTLKLFAGVLSEGERNAMLHTVTHRGAQLAVLQIQVWRRPSFVLVKAFNVVPISQARSLVRVNAFNVVPISCAAIAWTNDLVGQGLG